MANRVSLALFLMLAACAKENKKTSVAPQPLVADIPQDCKIYYGPSLVTVGTHVFPVQGPLYATTFDCGIREGRHCYYFLHVTAAGQSVDDVRCD